jgi:hypothetical protein
MGFIYSDLMVPPLVRVNATYYGWRVALYIAAVMYVSIVITALLLSGAFGLIDIVPQGRQAVSEIAKFRIDYTFWMNLVSIAIVGTMIVLRRYDHRVHDRGGHHMDHSSQGVSVKRIVALSCAVILVVGLATFTL